MKEEKKESKGLGNTTLILMISTAIFFDVLQWLLAFVFMDWFVSIFAFLTFYVWYKMRGLKFTTVKRAGTMASAFIVEIVPFLAMLPAWTTAVVILGLDSKIKKVVPGLDIMKK